jgi:hypothetical protein
MSKYDRQLMKWQNDKMTREQNDQALKNQKSHYNMNGIITIYL